MTPVHLRATSPCRSCEVCIKRPVFATSWSWPSSGGRRHQLVRSASTASPPWTSDGDTCASSWPGAPPRRWRRRSRRRSRKQVNTIQGIQGAALDLQPRQLDHHHHLRAEPPDRRGRPGRARQGLHRPAQPAARHPRADHLQDRQRPGPGGDGRAVGRPLHPRAGPRSPTRRSRCSSSARPASARSGSSGACCARSTCGSIRTA